MRLEACSSAGTRPACSPGRRECQYPCPVIRPAAEAAVIAQRASPRLVLLVEPNYEPDVAGAVGAGQSGHDSPDAVPVAAWADRVFAAEHLGPVEPIPDMPFGPGRPGSIGGRRGGPRELRGERLAGRSLAGVPPGSGVVAPVFVEPGIGPGSGQVPVDRLDLVPADPRHPEERRDHARSFVPRSA